MNGRFELRQKQFPILSQACRLAGWTARAPYFEGTLLRHPEAEKLVGTPIVILPALLMVEAHIRIAGGDPDPEGLWVLAIAHASCVRKLPIAIRHE